MANYKLDNFIKIPIQTDKKLFIYNSSGVVMYSLDPLNVNFFSRNNFMIIDHIRNGIEDDTVCRNRRYAELDFSSESEANAAKEKANDCKNILLGYTGDDLSIYLTKDEAEISYLSANTFDNNVNFNIKTDGYVSATTYYGDGSNLEGVVSSLSGLTDTQISDLQENDILIYSGDTWVNSTYEDPKTKNSIPSTVTVGAISPGDIITSGSTLDDFITQLVSQTYYPTFTSPSASLSSSISNSESGTISNITLTLNFSKGSINGNLVDGIWNPSAKQNNRTGLVTNYTIDGTDLDLINNKILTDYQVVDGANSWTSQVDYAEGPQPLDSLGNNYNSPYNAGSLSPGRTIYGYRKLFYGFSNDALDSDDIRSLSNSLLNPSNGTTFTINIPNGATNVVFAYPATLRDVNTVKYVEGLNAEVKGIFTQTTLNVEGANNYTAISYKIYKYTPASPFDDTATYTYNVTI